jgi:putative transposase
MKTYTQILYQIVFSTKYRELTLEAKSRPLLFNYMAGILKKKRCHPYRINGIEDHLHILTHLHPSISLSNLVKDIKLASTDMIKKNKIFPIFGGWQDGYGAFTYSIKQKNVLIDYIKNQEQHHKVQPFIEEFKELLNEHEIEFDEKYLL